MNLRKEQQNCVFIESCIGCDRLSTASEVRRAMELSVQTNFGLGGISNELSNAESSGVGVLLEKLAWAALCDGTLSSRNN